MTNAKIPALRPIVLMQKTRCAGLQLPLFKVVPWLRIKAGAQTLDIVHGWSELVPNLAKFVRVAKTMNVPLTQYLDYQLKTARNSPRRIAASKKANFVHAPGNACLVIIAVKISIKNAVVINDRRRRRRMIEFYNFSSRSL